MYSVVTKVLVDFFVTVLSESVVDIHFVFVRAADMYLYIFYTVFAQGAK